MSDPEARWTGTWVADKLRPESGIARVELVSAQVLRVERKTYDTVVIGTIAAERVESSTIVQLLESYPDIAFLANVPPEAFWTGGAIAMAHEHSVAYGGMLDLRHAISLSDPRTYVQRDVAYVEQGLSQHSKVTGFERIHDRKYLVKRRDRKDLTIVWLNEYELTVDHVRRARNRYGEFDILVRTNPNGGITTAAKEAVESMGAAAYDWRDFFGRLNRP